MNRGVKEEKLLALNDWRDSSHFTTLEKQVLEYTEAITHTDRQVTDSMVAPLVAAFGEKGLIDLTALIAFQNMSSKFNAALEIPAHGFCQIPPTDIT